jgi:hypothetical protein
MGLARLLVMGVAILVVVALIVLGVLALIGSLNSEGAPAPRSASSSVPAAPPASATPPAVTSPGPSATSAPAATPPASTTPTLFVECRADRCPLFVRISGGDIVEDRDLTRGQQAVYDQPRLDVVLGDASGVYVEVNGEPREPGEPGERQAFTVEPPG